MSKAVLDAMCYKHCCAASRQCAGEQRVLRGVAGSERDCYYALAVYAFSELPPSVGMLSPVCASKLNYCSTMGSVWNLLAVTASTKQLGATLCCVCTANACHRQLNAQSTLTKWHAAERMGAV